MEWLRGRNQLQWILWRRDDQRRSLLWVVFEPKRTANQFQALTYTNQPIADVCGKGQLVNLLQCEALPIVCNRQAGSRRFQVDMHRYLLSICMFLHIG